MVQNAQVPISPPPQESAPGFDGSLIWHYLNIFRRRVSIVLTVFVIVLTIGIVQAWRAPKIYAAKTQILVEKQVPRAMKFEGVLQESMWWDPDYYQTQADLVRSRAIMEQTLKDPEIAGMFRPSTRSAPQPRLSFPAEMKRSLLAMLGSAPLPPPEPWERLRGRVRSEHLADTHIIQILVEDTVPQTAAAIANAASRAFVDYNLQQKKDMYGDTFQYLMEEKRREEEALLRAQTSLQDFRLQARTISLDVPEDKQPLVDELSKLNGRRTETRLQRIELSSQLAVIETLSFTTNLPSADDMARLMAIPAIRNDANVQLARVKVDDARKAALQLRETYGPDHPKMIAAQNEIELNSQTLQQAALQTISSLKNRVVTMEKEEQQLDLQYEKQQGSALELAKELFEFSRLKEEVERHRRLFDSLSDRLIEIDLSAGFLRTNARIVEQASIPAAPVRPNRQRMVLIAAFLGLLFGSGLALFTEALDNTVRTPEDMRSQTGLRVFGFIPHISLRDLRRQTDAAGAATAPDQPSPDASVDSAASRGTFSMREQMSSISEAYRNIRTNLFYSFPGTTGRALGITSCTPGEGKTTTATNLALVMAMADKRVLLIDGDLHRPNVHRILDMDNDVGLSNVLHGDAEPQQAIQTIPIGNRAETRLFVMPAGVEPPNPSELITSPKTEALYAWARANFDWVLVDMPPVLFVSDAGVLSVLADGVLLVVRSGVNNRSMLARAQEHMGHLGTKIIGGILNDVQVSRMGRYYSDYYYHGYSKYSRDYHRAYRGRRERDTDAPSPSGQPAPPGKSGRDEPPATA